MNINMDSLQIPLTAPLPPWTSPTPIAPAFAKPSPLPGVTPTIYDPNAPDPQRECPGYQAYTFQHTKHGFTADLRLADEPCNVFGNDIQDLVLEVSHQTSERLSVKIFPKYTSAQNSSWFVLDDQFVQLPEWNGITTAESSELQFQWSNEPSFQFSVSRTHTDEELFSTFGHVIVYEDQFLELATHMVDDYSIYGLAETVRNFRFGTNFTATLFNVDSADALDRNSYGSHPFYQETRYRKGRPSTAHGVYARNVHGQEWLMREKTLIYRTLGGSFDLYFFSGQDDQASDSERGSRSSAINVIRQYQQSIGFPALQQYWAFGFHQCHWGWSSIQDLQDVINGYATANVPVESIWTDLDTYDRYRPWTINQEHFPSDKMKSFVGGLRARGQHYVTFVDSNVYYPNPDDPNDVYPPFDRGDALGTFIRDSETGSYYVGNAWPGNSVWADWFVPSSQKWMTNEMRILNDNFPYDAIWIDVNEASNFCNGLCGQSSRLASLADDNITRVEHDPRKLNFPPYKINNARLTNQMIDGAIPLDAFHNDRHNTREYEAHNLFSVGICKAAYNALATTVHPGKRPFIISRSTAIGSGRYSGHWGGDNESKWGAMYLSISQALTFQMAGVPLFGTDTCGFGGPHGPGEELCARWFELNAFMPFFRNHYGVMRPPQEAYVWRAVAEGARRAISIRYSLLTYLYTLFYFAHTRGDPVLRALAWEFPNDVSLRETDMQYFFGQYLLVTPVLAKGATTVDGVLPGIGEGIRWYDWYTQEEVTNVRPGENITMEAPLEHINLHIRGGAIIPLQTPGYTTTETRKGAYSLLIALDDADQASGCLYLDDGESIEQKSTRLVKVCRTYDYHNDTLWVSSEGSYHAPPPLDKVVILGFRASLQHAVLTTAGVNATLGSDVRESISHALVLSDLQSHFRGGAWEQDFAIHFR